MKALRHWLIERALRRPPDFVITDEFNPDTPYMLRWYMIPRNKWFNIYLHKFLRSDNAEALHDHPWAFNASWLLEGEYTEHVPGVRTELMQGAGTLHEERVPDYQNTRAIERKEGAWYFRWGNAAHRVELHNGLCTTLFITGWVVRVWGFYCPKGFIPFKQFTIYQKGSSTQKGCADV